MLATGACGSGSSDQPAAVATAASPATTAASGSTAAPATTSAAASTTPLLDTEHVQAAIAASIKAQRKVAADVTCPRVVPQVKGVLFRCHASSAIGKATFVVTQTDAAGHVTYVSR
jgi:hypothetical protein